MTHIRTFRDLDAWRVGMDAALATYRLTPRLPDTERYGLISQMRRAATSVPSNVAEGQARNSPKAFLHFLAIAPGSTAELDTQLELCVRLKYFVPEATADLRESFGTAAPAALRSARRETARTGSLTWTGDRCCASGVCLVHVCRALVGIAQLCSGRGEHLSWPFAPATFVVIWIHIDVLAHNANGVEDLCHGPRTSNLGPRTSDILVTPSDGFPPEAES